MSLPSNETTPSRETPVNREPDVLPETGRTVPVSQAWRATGVPEAGSDRLTEALEPAVRPLFMAALERLARHGWRNVRLDFPANLGALEVQCGSLSAGLRFHLSTTPGTLTDPVLWMFDIHDPADVVTAVVGALADFDDSAALDHICDDFVGACINASAAGSP